MMKRLSLARPDGGTGASGTRLKRRYPMPLALFGSQGIGTERNPLAKAIADCPSSEFEIPSATVESVIWGIPN